MDEQYQKILNILKKAGYKITKPRQAVINILTSKQHPLTAAEIYHYLPTVNLSSIYRVLDILTHLNIVQVEQIKNTAFYYLSLDSHHHIICEQCGYRQCLPCHHTFADINNFTNIKHQLILTGICHSCAIKLNRSQ